MEEDKIRIVSNEEAKELMDEILSGNVGYEDLTGEDDADMPKISIQDAKIPYDVFVGVCEALRPENMAKAAEGEPIDFDELGKLVDLDDEVITITYFYRYCYLIEFSDGVSGLVDFDDIINSGKIYEPLKDIKYFQTAYIEGGTITWPNGADVAVEYLQQEVTKNNKLKYVHKK